MSTVPAPKGLSTVLINTTAAKVRWTPVPVDQIQGIFDSYKLQYWVEDRRIETIQTDHVSRATLLKHPFNVQMSFFFRDFIFTRNARELSRFFFYFAKVSLRKRLCHLNYLNSFDLNDFLYQNIPIDKRHNIRVEES